MDKHSYPFSGSKVDYYFQGSFSYLKKIADPSSSVILTDENVFRSHKSKFKGWKTIILKPGEEQKTQHTADSIIHSLIKLGADRNTWLIAVGGGVITDLAGYVASVYMRGIRFGFVPTTILALVDASIGGKNGIDVGEYKNLVGVIRQPAFILHDTGFLKSLPQPEWENGFAEIIKHGCVKDAGLFGQLEEQSLSFFRQKKIIDGLNKTNVLIKTKIVQKDEFETGERRILNFGHTLGHALETQYELSHGQAISIGMVAACRFSEQLTGFTQTDRVVQVIKKYNLPVLAEFDKQKVFDVMRMDKKKEKKQLNFIFLEKIGTAVVKPVPVSKLEKFIQSL
jgi:3-dehydroquinate synthase